jgi:hypothetical protein
MALVYLHPAAAADPGARIAVARGLARHHLEILTEQLNAIASRRRCRRSRSALDACRRVRDFLDRFDPDGPQSGAQLDGVAADLTQVGLLIASLDNDLPGTLAHPT